MLTRGFVVKVIARIPSLAPGASPRLAPSVAAAEEPSIAAACDRPTRRRREPTRLAKQERVARMQAFEAAPGTVAR